VIDGDTPERTRDAAAALAARLTQRPDLFRGVFAPGTGSFFETHGLLYVDIETLEKFSDRVIGALPFISALARDPTVERLFRLINSAITREDPGRLTPSRLPDLMEAVSTILEAPLANEGDSFSWRNWILGEDADSQARLRRLVLAQPVHDYDDMVSAARPVAAVRQAIDDLGLAQDLHLRVRITGNPALGTDEMSLVAEQAGVFAVAGSLVFVTFFLFYAMRSVRLVLATLTPLILGLSWTTAFAALAVGHLNLVSIAFAVLFIGLGVDFGIHFALRFRELIDSGGEPEEALLATGRDVGGSLALCAATTAIGFYAFIPTRYAGVAELGLIAGSGMFISLLANLLVLPAVLRLFPVVRRTVETKAIEQVDRSLTNIPVRHAGGVSVLFLVAALAAAVTLP
jgi:hopanoid biosynthesis associated RND transporter like protein HpnN